MGAFEYSALDATGKTRKGVLEGDTARHVRQKLKERGLSPLVVNPSGERRRQNRRVATGGFAAGREVALFTRQLATLIGSGAMPEEALRVVAGQADSMRLQGLLLSVRAKVLEGASFADALAGFPGFFPEIYRATVAAGEHSGQLDRVLEKLAIYIEFRQKLRQKILLSLIYPALLTVVALLITVGLLTWVVPEIARVFAGMKRDLPVLTRVMIAASGQMRQWGWLLAVGLVGAVLLGRLLLSGKAVRRYLHRLVLRLPLLRKVVIAMETARFARAFGILVASGVPVVESLGVSAAVLGNLVLREAVLQAAVRVREGGSLHQALAAGGVLPPMFLHFVASGEAAASLGSMLELAASEEERTMEAFFSVLMGLFEPCLILLMGGVVLVIVLSIMLPIFDLNQLVR